VTGPESKKRDWERIVRIGVFPEVSSVEVYTERVALGTMMASAMVSKSKELVPSIGSIQAIHGIAFGAVHPWAGEFRRPGQEVMVGNFYCSDAKDITKELNALNKDMLSNPLKGSRKYLLEVVAYYHASYLAIHPFLDGNGRTSRLILDNQSRNLLGHPIARDFSRDEYVGALALAQQQGDLRSLVSLLDGPNREKKIQLEVAPPEKKREPTKKDLIKLEKELLSKRRKLGFTGSDIDEHYGLGGFPKPLSEKEIFAKAENIIAEGKADGRTIKRLILDLAVEDSFLSRERKLVSDELLAVRQHLIKKSRKLDSHKQLGKKR